MNTERKTCIVKWYNDNKGYGFVEFSDGTPDAFLHYSAMEWEGFKSVVENQTLEVEILMGPKGPQVSKAWKRTRE